MSHKKPKSSKLPPAPPVHHARRKKHSRKTSNRHLLLSNKQSKTLIKAVKSCTRRHHARRTIYRWKDPQGTLFKQPVLGSKRVSVSVKTVAQSRPIHG